MNVTGVSTFASAADFNGDVDIDGHTELDDVNASGISSWHLLTLIIYRHHLVVKLHLLLLASKDTSHRYYGTGSGNGYLINGVQAP